MKKMTDVFFGRRVIVAYKEENLGNFDVENFFVAAMLDHRLLAKVLDIELSLMYDDMYTKGALLRKRSSIAIRCTSQVCIIGALVTFAFMSNKQAPGIISHSSVGRWDHLPAVYRKYSSRCLCFVYSAAGFTLDMVVARGSRTSYAGSHIMVSCWEARRIKATVVKQNGPVLLSKLPWRVQ
uniref:DUF4220 domain-containing protein n=1 Tax=Oryza brachyantha TaxID=4533 RepID=J3MR93_ORYBR